MRKKLVVLVTVFMTFIFLHSEMRIYADSTINIDGNFDDWNDLKHLDVTSSNSFYSRLLVTYDDEYIYIHGKESQYGVWEPYTYMRPEIITEDGSTVYLSFTPGDSIDYNDKNIVVRNQYYSEISGAQGIRKVTNGLGEIEIKIPISEVGVPSKIKVNLSYDNQVEYEVSKLENGGEGTEASTEDTKGSTQENKTEQTSTSQGTSQDGGNSTSGIIIDGFFDDWSDRPHSYVINWDMPSRDRNKYNCRQISMVADGDYLYVHVIMRTPMNGEASEQFNGNYYSVIVGGKVVKVYLTTANGGALPGTSLGNGNYTLTMKYVNGQGIPDNTVVDGSDAKLIVSSGKPDECEFKIPLNVFEKIYGKKLEDVKEIKLENPNMFLGAIVTAGTSTSPIFAVFVCCAATLLGMVYISTRSKKR